MASQTVTVFGGSGFVGRYVVRAIAESGARVRVAVRNPDQAGFLKVLGDVGQIVPVAANIRNSGSVAAALDGADAVINLVGILFQGGRQKFAAIHEAGAAQVAQAAQAAGVGRLVHVSALGADPEAPSKYARSKAAGEAAVRAAFPGATIVRPGVVFGPEAEFFQLFAALARVSPVLPLFGGGKTRFQPVYCGDVALAIARLLADPETSGATYELGGPRIYTLREMIEAVLAACGRRRLLIPVPFFVATALAAMLELLPIPLVTVDQVRQLRTDNVATGALPGLAELGITANGLEAMLPAYLQRYRRPGLNHA